MPRRKVTETGLQKLSTNEPALLFDLDGTLIDSVYQHISAWGEVFRENRIYVPLWKIHRRIGMSGQLFVPMLLREIGHKPTKNIIEKLERRHKTSFERSLDGITTLPGADALLQELNRRKIRWAIASSGGRGQVQKLIGKLRRTYSAPIVTGDDVKSAKPAPDIFLAAAEKLGLPLSECIVVGDSPWDLLAARRAKSLGVGLLCGGYAKEELESAGAHRIYESPLAFLENLADIGIYPEL